MKKLIVAGLIAAASVPALAWGDREQGALAGIAGTIILQQIMRNGQVQVPPVVQPIPPVINMPFPGVYGHPPVIRQPVCAVQVLPRADNFGNIYYEQRIVCL
jgi:hypothetical protein